MEDSKLTFYEQLRNINDSLEKSKVDIKGKKYSLVNDRVKAFRQLIPEGAITTEILSMEAGVVVIKATITDETGKVLAVGHSYEKESNGMINKTSYIENCETSAIGRALGFLGIGIDQSIASAEDVATAIANQDGIGEEEFNEIETLIRATGCNKEKLLEQYKLESFITIDRKRYKVLRDKLVKALREQMETDKT